ncbi:MAG: hypothetical protein AUJ98_06700 [Bacteroidetes bacterium CG2_30_33_31]|nr:MAG: hypothetical protein AUJ98_06700 [Bacteroidetes bacterium CG2_30_33_31]
MKVAKDNQPVLKRFYAHLKYKYKLVIMNESTLKEEVNFRLSRLNVIILLGFITFITIVFTIFIISVTSLKEYIPGFASVEQIKQVYLNNARIDSLEIAINDRDLYLQNLKETILMGKPMKGNDTLMLKKNKNVDYKGITIKHSKEDSLLRDEWDNKEQYDLIYYPDKQNQKGLESFIFFTPLRGIVTNGFNIYNKHYGIDVAGEKDKAIKATLDGMVIFSLWTFETGYVIAIQHQSNLISVYKHCSALLKKEGDYVKAGSPIAIIGNTGEMTSGPHLHFELWYNANTVNPADFITFE